MPYEKLMSKHSDFGSAQTPQHHAAALILFLGYKYSVGNFQISPYIIAFKQLNLVRNTYT